MASKKKLPPITIGIVGEPIKEDDDSPEVYINSSHGNKSSINEDIKDIFEKTFVTTLNKTPFEADEILIYRYGVVIRPRHGDLSTETLEKVQRILSVYPGSSIVAVKEAETFSLKINLGNPKEGELAGNVSSDFEISGDILNDIYNYISDEYGDSEWFAFWETEEFLGGSP